MKRSPSWDIERRGMDILMPYMARKAHNGRFVPLSDGRSASLIQTTFGIDVAVSTSETAFITVECKFEQCDRYGTFFLETWSNRNFCMRKVGWMVSCSADYLWYYFIEQDDLYQIDFRRLWEWSFTKERIYAFPERAQGKYDQLNATFGRSVPIETVRREVGLKLVHPRYDL